MIIIVFAPPLFGIGRLNLSPGGLFFEEVLLMVS